MDIQKSLDRVLQQGLMHLDALLVLRDVIWPVILNLSDYLVTPYFLSRTLLVVVKDYYRKTLVMRFALWRI